MDRAQIQAEWDKFIEYPSDDKRIVTTTSALLFVEYIAKLQPAQDDEALGYLAEIRDGFAKMFPGLEDGLLMNAIGGPCEVPAYVLAVARSLQPAQEPAQAGELPDEREAFEREMRCEEEWGHRSLKRRADGGYENWQVALMWSVWQARAALAARKPLTDEAYKLWMLLDDIDTADDMAKADNDVYRSLVRRIHKQRFDILSGEQIDAIRSKL